MTATNSQHFIKPAGITDLNELTKDQVDRLIRIGKRLPSITWWYAVHPTLGCSPREAVDAMRIDEVERLLPA